MIPVENIVSQHPDSVGLVFLKYGVDVPITPESLQAALSFHGEPFAEELANAVSNEFEVFIGKDGKKGLFKGDKIKTLFQNVRSKIAPGKNKPVAANQNLTPAQKQLSNDLNGNEILMKGGTPDNESLRDQIRQQLSRPMEPEKKMIQQHVKDGLKAAEKKPGALGKIGDFLSKGLGAIDDVRDILQGEDDPKVLQAQSQSKSIWPSIIGFGVVLVVVAVLYFIGKNKE